MGDWNAAVSLNESLLEENPEDIDTLNRLAFAYASIGNTKDAKTLYQKVLHLDSYNPIALRNLKRLNGGTQASNGQSIQMNNIFIEEPGKTKVLELINVAEKKLISKLRAGEYVHLQVKRMKIFVLDADRQYLGMLPDDVGRRLIEFMTGGNEYEAYVKTVDNLKLIIFIKETLRSPRFKNQPSFPSFDKTRFVLDGANGKGNGSKNKTSHVEDESGGENESD